MRSDLFEINLNKCYWEKQSCKEQINNKVRYIYIYYTELQYNLSAKNFVEGNRFVCFKLS
jgi:hypothetical protein